METRPPENDTSPERRILDAALSEFADKGFFGARTQAIAEAAGVNKALLHYYFRSKEKLYQTVIYSAFRGIQGRIYGAWSSDGPLETRVERVIDAYMNVIGQNPGIVKIIMREVVDGGRLLRKAFENSGEDAPFGGRTPLEMMELLGAELGIGPRAGMHAFINLIGMCVISFISPVVLEAVARIDTSDFDSYLAERRTAVKAMMRAYARTIPAGLPDGGS